jgi:predicted DCC family thiol-disulfide oxidoreductase YuxK
VTLVFDGDCGFCTTSAGLARRIAPGVATVAWQHADLAALGLTADEASARVQFVDANGTASGGAAAVAHLLTTAGPGWRILGRLLLAPGVRSLAEIAYRLVARYRYRLPGGTPACRLPP